MGPLSCRMICLFPSIMNSRLLFFAVVLLCCVCCSVREDRTGCPCDIFVDLSSETVALHDSVAVTLTAASGGASRTLVVYPRDYAAGVHILSDDPRAEYVAVYPAQLQPYYRGGCFLIPSGLDCPAIHSFNAVCETTGDRAAVTAVLHKNHCRVNLRFVSSKVHGYSVSLLSDYGGYDKEGAPLKTDFRYELRFDKYNMCEFCIPRQADNSMQLDIRDTDALLRRFALGNLIELSGYDWRAADLRDITMTIDYSAMKMKIGSDAWNTEIPLQVAI